MSAATAARPEVVGFVEAVTDARVLGWAWAPRSPAEPVTVELRLGDTVIAEAASDLPREDLARNGVGDGRHAFELPVPEAHRGRASELTVHARRAGGGAVLLGMPAPPGGVGERLDQLQAAVGAVINSQRLLHRNIQAALLRRAEQDGSGDHAAHAALADQVTALQVFMGRLDERLAALRAPPVSPAGWSRATAGALGLAATALCVSITGLLRSLPG